MELIVISPTRLKIMLTEPDMRRYEISSDTATCESGRTRKSLRRLFADARRETGFDTEGARLLIQLYASLSGGCEIFVTKLGDQEPDADALTPPEQALLRRVFGEQQRLATAVQDEPQRREATSMIPEPPAVTAIRPVAVLLPDAETLLSLCRRLAAMGYAQESRAYALDDESYCLFLQVPDTTFYRLPLNFAFLTEYGCEADAAHLSEYLSEHGTEVCGHDAVSRLAPLGR